MSDINIKDVKITFGGIEITELRMCKCQGANCKHFIELSEPDKDGMIDCMCKKTGEFFEVEEFHTFEENDEDCPNAFEAED